MTDKNEFKMNKVGVQDDPLGETHEKFKSITNNIQFNPVGEHERSSSQLKEDKKLVDYKERPQKRHGFDLPLHPLQIMTFILFGFNILVFYIVVIPSIVDYESPGRQALSGCLGTIYGILLILVVKYTYETTITDPTDKTVLLEREAQLKGYDVVGFDISQYQYFCNVCKTHVLEHTKHCQQCNRCVQQFDHHCPWLNNCIGVMNYKPFIKMLSWVTISILYQEVCTIISFHFKEHFQTFDQSQTKHVWMLHVVSMCLNAPVFLGLLKLLTFHFFLMRDGLTTYQHILMEREKATNQKQQSKVIVKSQKEEFPQLDLFQHSPRYSSDDNDKQKTKDMSERNQFIRELTPPIQSESSNSKPDTFINPDEKQTKCSMIRFLKSMIGAKDSPRKSDNLPKSIKVQPIHNAGTSSLPRSQSQLEDVGQLSAGEDDGPTPVGAHCKTLQQQAQTVFNAPSLSNRNKTQKYEPQHHETQDYTVKQKTQLVDEEALKMPQQKNTKKTSIVHQKQAIEEQLYDIADSYRFSNKYDDILKADQFRLESKTSQERLAKGRSPLNQADVNRSQQSNHLRKVTLQQTPLIDNNISCLSVEQPGVNSNNANLKQVLNQHLNNVTFKEVDYVRKNSRNQLERVNSDMQSITSKQGKRQPYELKSLA